MLRSLLIQEKQIGLLTDLYELTMSAAFWSHDVKQTATFELYFRRLPRNRSYIIAAGLEQALHYLTSFRFPAESIDYLRSLDVFKNVKVGFWDYLAELKFTGNVRAMPEGTPVFPLEPLIQVTAPLIEAQIAETYLLSVMNMQSMIATKAARVVSAARGTPCIEFGTRRAHGPQAALYAARGAYIGGCVGTSNTLAGMLCDIPVFGTAAHSFIMAFPTEMEAFQSFQSVFPNHSTLLIDTYDTLAAAENIKGLGKIQAVRIDSGDLADLARKVRAILDGNGMKDVKIFLSGDLNEYKIHEFQNNGVPVDFFGVGTELSTSYDDPAMSGVYKIVEIESDGKMVPKIKVSPAKPSYPGKKQVYRLSNKDVIALDNESPPKDATPLLKELLRDGKLNADLPSIHESKRHAAQCLAQFPQEFLDVTHSAKYEVQISDSLTNLHKEIAQKVRSH